MMCCRWTEHDKASRAEWFEELFLALDLKLMTPTFLANSVENNLLVLASEKCKVRQRSKVKLICMKELK